MRRAGVLLALAAALAAAGCGGDDDGDGGEAAQPQTAPATTPEAAQPTGPEGVFLQFQTALADGDADAACGLLTDAATQQVEESSIGGSCADGSPS